MFNISLTCEFIPQKKLEDTQNKLQKFAKQNACTVLFCYTFLPKSLKNYVLQGNTKLQRGALCMTTRSTMRTKNTEKSTRKIFQITFRRQIPGVNIKRIFSRDIHGETLSYLFCKFEQIFRRPSPKPPIYLTLRSTTLYFVMYFALLALSCLFLSDRFKVLISFFPWSIFFFFVALSRG